MRQENERAGSLRSDIAYLIYKYHVKYQTNKSPLIRGGGIQPRASFAAKLIAF